jgi:glycine betaine/proline transport system permease protein
MMLDRITQKLAETKRDQRTSLLQALMRFLRGSRREEITAPAPPEASRQAA